MKKNLKNLFSEDVQKILTEDSINAIEKAINEKVELAVEAALLEQDEQYADKLQTLVKSIDKDHTHKMKRIVESVDKDRTAKLVKVIKKYERDINYDLTKFKKQIVESIGSFIDTFIEESVPKKDIEQAVKNKTAYNVLENMRKVFAIDLSVMNESIAPAVMEGKKEIDALRKENEQLKRNTALLKEQKDSAEKRLFIENKVASFSEDKRKFITKALSDKSLDFVKENFDYTIRLYDKQEKKTREMIKEEALKDRKHKPDFVKNEKIVTEKVNKDVEEYDPYVEEMKRLRF
jgi:flagellar biosynthesis regulator FlbT